MVEIRAAHLADVPAIAELLATNGESVAVWRQRISADLAKDNRKVLVAITDGCVVGYGQLIEYVPPATGTNTNPRGWYLAGVTVDPAHRRRGIGAALTQARMAWAQQVTDTLYYIAEPENQATLRLHERFGFVIETDAAPLPGADRNGIRGRCDLAATCP